MNKEAERVEVIQDSSIIAELKTFPHQSSIWETLEATAAKKAYRLPSSKSFIIIEHGTNNPYIAIAGMLNEVDVDTAINLCSGMERPKIFCNPKYHHLFLSHGWVFNLRIELRYDEPKIINIQNDWKIYPIDNFELFKKCQVFERKLIKYQSIEKLVESASGYVLCNDDEIISEIYIVRNRTHDHAEIDIHTKAKYRGLGAGSQIASFIAEKCLEINKVPIWSCQADNIASLNTALKIGFRIKRYYMQLTPKGSNIINPATINQGLQKA